MNAGRILVAAILMAGGSFTVVAADQSKPVMGIVPQPVPKQIHSQGRIIYIKSREGKPTLFTIKTRDGKVLAKNTTLDGLQRRDPPLARFLRRALNFHRISPIR